MLINEDECLDRFIPLRIPLDARKYSLKEIK